MVTEQVGVQFSQILRSKNSCDRQLLKLAAEVGRLDISRPPVTRTSHRVGPRANSHGAVEAGGHAGRHATHMMTLILSKH